MKRKIGIVGQIIVWKQKISRRQKDNGKRIMAKDKEIDKAKKIKAKKDKGNKDKSNKGKSNKGKSNKYKSNKENDNNEGV